MNNHLVSLEKLKKVAKEKGLLKYIKEIGYSKVVGKKYYVITIDNKKVNFGYNKMDDFLIHHDMMMKEERDLKIGLNHYMKNLKMIITNMYFGVII